MTDGVDQVCARAVLLSPDERVLLMEEPLDDGNALWVTPGGRVEEGESLRDALIREMHEELGLVGIEEAPEIWVRHGEFTQGGRRIREREHLFLVRVEVFEPQPTHPEDQEKQRFVRFRWWAVDEILASDARFAPARIGTLLETLLREGPPETPIDSGP